MRAKHLERERERGGEFLRIDFENEEREGEKRGRKRGKEEGFKT